MKQTSTTFSPTRGMINRKEFLLKIASAPLDLTVSNKKVAYYNVPSAFDIETSSFYTGDGKNRQKNAVMYVWQFGILNWVTYGRTWQEFKLLIELLSDILELNENRRLVIYVHNLPYEFQFIRKLLTWDKVFLLENRKPVYALWGGMEFRCSLKLASKSLEKVGEDLVKYKEEKKVGDLDYQLVRFPTTPLTAEELGYCEGDIRVLLAYIQEKIETDGSVAFIPLTNTGYVRNYCRKECFKKYKQYRELMSELTLTPDEYAQLKRAFAGGFTHASAKYVAKILEAIGSFDFTSSYPAAMLLEKFPMSKAKVIEHLTVEEFHQYLKDYCCLFDITIHHVRPKVSYDHPISQSKLILPSDKEERDKELNDMVVDNGRIVFAKKITLTMTEHDWWVFNKFYEYGDDESKDRGYEIHSMRIYEKGYLPKAFYMSILELYKKKTELKDVAGEEVNYMILKNMLNAAYGMIVTDIVRDIFEYENGVGYLDKKKPDLIEAIEKYNNSKKRFLFYPWGVWVTALARRNLFSGILACGNDYVYSDTDSIKIKNPESHMDYINAYNDLIMKKIEMAAKHYNIPVEMYSPKNIKGEAKTIGVWDYEGKYKRFKTLGAKRYMFERYPEDINPKKKRFQYSITVAGVNKIQACDYLVKKYKKDPMKGFTHKLVVPSDYSGRLTLTYIDEPRAGTYKDYLGNEYDFYEESSIHMEPSDYNMTLSENYRTFLQFCYGIEEDSW